MDYGLLCRNGRIGSRVAVRGRPARSPQLTADERTHCAHVERVGRVERSETHQIRSGKMMGFARAQPILPRSSPAVVSRLARRTGRQTSGAARWAAGRRAIAGGDGAARITGGDGAARIIGRRVGMAGALMRGRGRCRQRGAEKDCGGQRDCCPARHCRISGLSCRGLARRGLTASALSRHGDGDR
jgi:hypothetical protein